MVIMSQLAFLWKIDKVKIHSPCGRVLVFLGKEHESAFLIERNGSSVCINRDEATSTPTHCGENVFHLQ